MQPYTINYIHKKCGGVATIFLHGWGGDLQSFGVVQKALFVDSYNFDLYGFGSSEMPKPFFDTYEYAKQIYLFLISKNIKKINIVCHSFGFRLALVLTACFDLDVGKIIATGGAGVGLKKSFYVRFKIILYKFLKRIIISQKCKNILHKVFSSVDYKSAKTNAMKETFKKVVSQDLTYLLDDIKCDVVLFWGRHDKSTPISVAKTLTKRLASIRLIVDERGDHFVYLKNISQFINLCENELYM